MPTTAPPVIHGLKVIQPEEAALAGFVSITNDINSVSEEKILAGVCQHRDPERACLLLISTNTYQLAILHVDVAKE